MPLVLESQTGSALLDVLQNPMDNGAWKTFVGRYRPKISGWCRQRGLKRGSVEEVTQIVLVKLVEKLRKYTYDPRKGRFRGWLKVLTDHAVVDYLIEFSRHGRVADPEAIVRIGSRQACKDLREVIERAFYLELLDVAMKRVQLQVSQRDWQIFKELALDELPVADVAEQYQLTVGAVLMVKNASA